MREKEVPFSFASVNTFFKAWAAILIPYLGQDMVKKDKMT